MTAPFDLFVFDVAGTTVWDGEDTVADCVCAALRIEAGIDLPIEAVNPVMGMQKPHAIRELIQNHRGVAPDQSEVDTVHSTFRRLVIEHYRDAEGVREMPGATELFRTLKGMGAKVTLDTGFDRESLDTIITRMGWGELLDSSCGSDEVDEGRPAPDMIHKLMRDTGVTDPSRVCKVGDSVSDLEQGFNAGCGLVVAMLNQRTKPAIGDFPDAGSISGLDELIGLLPSEQTVGAGV